MDNEVTLNASTIHWERQAIEKLLLAATVGTLAAKGKKRSRRRPAAST